MNKAYIDKLKNMDFEKFKKEILGVFSDSSEPVEYRKDILNLMALTGLKEDDLLREIAHVSVSLKDTAKFYASTGRFPTNEECELIQKVGIYNFFRAYNMNKVMCIQFPKELYVQVGRNSHL